MGAKMNTKNTDSFTKTVGIPITGGNLLIVTDSYFYYTV